MLTADDIVRDLEQFIVRELANENEAVARACAAALIKCLFLNSSGKHMIYVPTGEQEREQRKQLYWRIWQEFNGDNHQELARRFRLSVQHIYNITRHMRRCAMKSLQADLFPVGEPLDPEPPILLRVLLEYLPTEFEQAGLPAGTARILARQVKDYMIEQYAGIAFRITQAMVDVRLSSLNQGGLF